MTGQTKDEVAAMVERLRGQYAIPNRSGVADMLEAVAAQLAASEAARKAAEARVGELEAALMEISDRHIPDQPAAYGGDELEWAVRQHTELRRIASAALKGAKP